MNSPQNPDFAERLRAMREGRAAEGSQSPSLKDRLQKGAPQSLQNPSTDLKARIQAKFQKKAEPVVIEEVAPAPIEVSIPDEPLPEFEISQIPQKQADKAQSVDSWTPENGGVCPSCGTYNQAYVAFCGHCSYMLVRSEQAIEITTSYPLTELKGLVKAFADKLAKLNIRTTEDMLRIGVNHKNRQMLIKHTGMSDRSLQRLVHQSDFCRVPSMTPETAAMLELLGINTLPDLLKLKPLDVFNKIHQNKIKLNQTGIIFLPTKGQVSTWFEEARELAPIKIV